MTKKSRLVLPSTLVAWIAQAVTASLLVTMRSHVVDGAIIKGCVGLFIGYAKFYLIIYIPQFLFIFFPVSYLLHKLNLRGFIPSILCGISVGLLGIAFNDILLTPFSTTSTQFDVQEIIERYKQLNAEILATTGGAGAGCGHWLVTSFEKLRDRRRIWPDQPSRDDDPPTVDQGEKP